MSLLRHIFQCHSKQGAALYRITLSHRGILGVHRLSNFNSGSACYSSVASGQVMKDQIETWKAAHELFNSKERNSVEYPREGYGNFTPKVRLGFIPNSWFQFFYDKTGVTGPYMLGGGLITYLLSKEIWVMNHHFAHFISFWLLMAVLHRLTGRMLYDYFNKELDIRDDAMYYRPVRETKAAVAESINEVERVIGENENKAVVADIKQENLKFQLEAIYRQRIAEAHQAVKKRLDYQLDLQQAKTRFMEDHMINWIVDNVKRSITPQHERDALTNCINRLKELSKVKPATG